MWGCSLGISRDLGSRLKLLGIGGKKGFFGHFWDLVGFCGIWSGFGIFDEDDGVEDGMRSEGRKNI